MPTITALLALLAEHGDLIEEIVSAVASGTPKEAIRAAVKAVKKETSDLAFREELGIDK